MQYLGGKARLAKKFAPLIRAALDEGRTLVEPFVGGFNVLPALGPNYARDAVCSDIHPGLINLYKALQRGWLPTEIISEQRYAELKAAKEWSNPETAIAAFGCSFGAKEWGGYARNASGKNYCAAAARSLMRKQPFMLGVRFMCADYQALKCGHGHVIYADPPYLNTTGYSSALNHPQFYLWCEEQAHAGARVFVSEFTLPDRPGWVPVWSIERNIMVDSRALGGRTKRTDCLVEVKA